MMFSNRERNRSSIPDDTLRDGFITVLQSQSTGAENHVPQRKGIPKINYFKSQAFQAQNPFSCKSDYFAKPKELPTSAAYAFFTGDYVTEKLEDRTFIQRRFTSSEEQGGVIDQLREHGIDPTGKETEGHLLAEFYLSRPAKDAADMPIERLLTA